MFHCTDISHSIFPSLSSSGYNDLRSLMLQGFRVYILASLGEFIVYITVSVILYSEKYIWELYCKAIIWIQEG